MTVRRGKWKLRVENPTIWPKHLKGDWVDPRAPDGVTILAPCEQATPDDHPDVLTGDPAEPMMLFDLEAHRAARPPGRPVPFRRSASPPPVAGRSGSPARGDVQ